MTHEESLSHGLTVDILIPALNEEEALPFVLEPLIRLRDQGLLERSKMSLRRILVLDNGSEDATAEVARSAGAEVIWAPKRGYGSACLEGIKSLESSPPDILLFIDADGSDDLSDLDPILSLFIYQEEKHLSDQERLITTSSYRRAREQRTLSLHTSQHVPTDKVSMVIGSRARFAQPGALTPLQRFGNALSCTLLCYIFGARFTDLGPFRAIRWSDLKELEMSDENFGWTVEMQAKACAHDFLCAERDVAYHPRRAGDSKVSGSISGSIKAGIKILWVIGCAWWRR